MIMTFKTKRDTSGNTYFLDMDTDRKTYTIDYNRYWTPDADIIINKRTLNSIQAKLDREGYKREI